VRDSQFIGSIARDSLFNTRIIDIAHGARLPEEESYPNRGLPAGNVATSRANEGSVSCFGIRQTHLVGSFVSRDSMRVSRSS
jgi:hypothetical protein